MASSDDSSSSWSDSGSDSDSDAQEAEVNTAGILFFKKTPNDESRLAKNSIIYKRNGIEKGLTKDKRVTVQQVLDRRTYVRLKRLHGRAIFDFIYGVISTGKEANVYEAEGTLAGAKHRMAIKVYKTSILVFKDRSRYIEGEFRFRRSYVGTKNPRKMVSQWAEKEFRNLRRISLSGVYCPAPIALKDHILVMELVQDPAGAVASKLKDLGALTPGEWRAVYAQVIATMRVLYQESKLIHADFSAYNLLCAGGRVVVIDVSQAVENDHPNALYFLKRDCENITAFFAGVAFDAGPAQADEIAGGFSEEFGILTSFQLFRFVTADADFGGKPEEPEPRDGVDEYVDKMVLTSKNAKEDRLRETMVRKRAVYNALWRRVDELIATRDPLLFTNEDYESANFISHEACWNALKVADLSALSVDALDRLDREHGLPAVELPRADDDDSSTEPASAPENDTPRDNVKFNGKIPEGIDSKDWKRLVKQMNRERREHKIPKHIKKSFKRKHA